MDYLIPVGTILVSIGMAWGISQNSTRTHTDEIKRLRDRDEKQSEQITRLETKVDAVKENQLEFKTILSRIETEIFKIK